MLTGILPLLLIVGVIWLISRAVTARRTAGGPGADEPVDLAVSVRRLFLLGLLYVTLVVAAQGLVELFQEVFAGEDRSTAALARALAFLVVGAPAFGAFVWYVDRRLVAQAEERSSPAWSIYLNAALWTTLVGAMIAAYELIEGLLHGGDDRAFRPAELASALIWGGLWAGHWFVLRRRHGVTGDVDQAIGTLTGLAPMAIGAAGMLGVAFDDLYDAFIGDDRLVRGGPSAGAWAATLLVGAVVWAWYWLARYRTAPRTGVWWATVIPVGALTGFVAVVSTAAILIYTTAVWFLGEPRSEDAVRHFDTIPLPTAVLMVGAASFVHHRSFLRAETERNDAIRAYDYLLAMAALVTGIVGVVLLLVAVFGVGRSAVANNAIAGLTMVGVGAPIWWRFWTVIERHIEADRAQGGTAELRTHLRRIYLFSLFGIGGVAVLIAVLAVLTSAFEDLLEGTIDRDTFHRNRVGLAVILAVTGVAWYHFRVFRAERADYVPSPPPPPTVDAAQPPRRVVLVSPGTTDRAQELARSTGAQVVHWHRADQPLGLEPDLDELRALLAGHPGQDLLVLLGPGGPTVVPLVGTSDPG